MTSRTLVQTVGVEMEQSNLSTAATNFCRYLEEFYGFDLQTSL